MAAEWLAPVSVRGQLVHHRKLSQKCSFFDLLIATDRRVEAILKLQDDLALDQVKALRSRLVLGDEIIVQGTLEALSAATVPFNESPVGYLLHAKDITVVATWKETHPGETFVPLPALVHCDTPAQTTKTLEDKAPCKFWVNTGRCHKGAACPMRHGDASELKALRKAWLADRLHKKRLAAHQADDPTDPHAKQSKHFRAAIFASWLVETFGCDVLQHGTGVMDIAGGRGGVCFELWHHHHIPTTLIDPRPMRYTKRQHQYLKAHPTEKPVSQWLEMFELDTYVGDAKDEAKAAHVQAASLLLGMHPDEATDVIVDVALAHNKPFAIVPCCVFAEEFPDRRTPSGDPVTTYDSLVEYLMAKHPQVQSHFLPFDGRNRVLYYMGKRD
ncbi:hypothetical protein ACHHYP_13619 [Achlya hypogyna]|uniref:C3H1-type domain-containing protein n=1 Tax=Achlya hypogyna TaxID=1202772 RepID=A0A1V9ZFU3_ACHHY|nr:hypothetical protein ACHHYP_13619 [Achlya hypogyna]